MASFEEDLLLAYGAGNWVGIPNNAKTIEPEARICVKRQFDTDDDESTDKHFMEVKKLCTTLDTINVERYHEIFLCHDIREQLNRLNREVESFITRPEYLVPFLQPGRLIKVKKGNLTFDWGMIIDFEEISSKDLFYLYPKDKTVIIIDVLLHLSKDSEEGNLIPCREDEEGEMEVVPVLHNLVSQISLAKVPIYRKSYLKQIYFKPSCRKSALNMIQLMTSPNGCLSSLDPIIHMNIKDQACKDIVEKIKALEERLCMHCKNYKYNF